MSKESFKKTLDEDDFDLQIKSQAGTKILKLSSFNEKELGAEKEHNGKAKEDLKLEVGQVVEKGPIKRGLFNWKKKSLKEDDSKASSPTKSQGKLLQGQAMPQSIQQKQQRSVSTAKVEPNFTMQNYHSKPLEGSKFEEQAYSPPVDNPAFSQDEVTADEAQMYNIDPILMKNTDFNAAFIHVDNLGKAKTQKNNSKGVKFNTAVATIPSEFDSDEEEPIEKPTFAPRGSSMKNLESNRMSILPEAAFANRSDYFKPQNEPGFQDRQSYMTKSKPVPATPEPEISHELHSSLMLKQLLRNEGSQNFSPMPIPPTVNRQQTVNQLPTPKIAETPAASPKSIPTLDTSCQTDKDDREDLLNMISSLQAQIVNYREENGKQLQIMNDQKKGFDKLSAQAYRKIKELLTERNIMSIEMKSLRAQVQKMEVMMSELEK